MLGGVAQIFNARVEIAVIVGDDLVHTGEYVLQTRQRLRGTALQIP
jgi:hypothetical protein